MPATTKTQRQIYIDKAAKAVDEANGQSLSLDMRHLRLVIADRYIELAKLVS